MRQSLRQLIRKEPKCANCCSNCVNEKRVFSEILPLPLFRREDDSPGINLSRDSHDKTLEDGDSDIKVEGTNAGLRNNLKLQKQAFCYLKSSDAPEKPKKGMKVTVLDALLKIFNLHFKSQKGFLSSTIRDKDHLVLCNDCAYCLSQLYEWFSQFTKLTIDSKKNSYLHPVVFPNVPTPLASFSCGDFPENDDDSNSSSPKTPKKRGRKRKIIPESVSGLDGAGAEPIHHRSKMRNYSSSDDLELSIISYSSQAKNIKLIPCEVKIMKMTAESISAALKKINDEDAESLKNENYGYANHHILPDEAGRLIDEYHEFKPELEETIIPDGVVGYGSGISNFRRRGRPLVSKIAKMKRRNSGCNSKKTDCEECGKTFKNTNLLSAHLRIHRTIHKCKFCEQEYNTRGQLRDHLNLEHEDQKCETCPHCEKLFFTSTDAKKHIAIHLGKNPVVCGLCNTTFPSEIALKAHQLTHVSSEGKLPLFVCPVETCHKRYLSLQLLQSHVKYIHERRKDFVCHYPGCDKSFGTESYLNAHVVSHESTGTHLCDLCGKNYKHKKDLSIHKQRVHSTANLDELKPYACDVCSKRYYRADHLRMHRVKTDHYIGGQEPQIPEPQVEPMVYDEEYKCTVCNKDFISDIALKSHLLTHENESKVHFEYTCTECNRKYTTLKALEYHIKYMHRLKGTFTCPQCPKTFGRMSAFKRHLVVHSTTKHICGHCHKRYRNKADLFQHVRREHILGAECYKYECEVCQKRFYRTDMLRFHRIKSGHVASKKLGSDQDEVEMEQSEDVEEEVSVYVVETTEIQKDEAEIDEIIDEKEEDEESQNYVTIIPGPVDIANDSVDTLSEEEPILHSLNSIPLEMVEITGEDEGGTIAHVVMVDENGVAQDIETEVICSNQQEGHLDSDFKFFNYSIELE